MPFFLQCLFSYLVCIPIKVRQNYRKLIFWGDKSIFYYVGNDKIILNKLNVSAKYLGRTSISISIGIIFAALAYGIYPIYIYIWKNERAMIIPIITPFFDPDSVTGYHTNIVIQLSISTVGIMGIIGLELITSIMVVNVYTAVKIIECDLNELNKLLLNENAEKYFVNQYLREIVVKIQDIDR